MIDQFIREWKANEPPANLISIGDLNRTTAETILSLARQMKTATKEGSELFRFSQPTAAAMIFEKPSLRTRVTFEVGLYQMGAHAVYLAQQDIRMGEREAVMDVARNLGRWVQAVIARVFHHSVLYELAQHTNAPVVNALSDHEHPCQALADLMTVQEWKGNRPMNLAWVGDGNNVCHSYLLLGALLGHHMRVATPEGYEVENKIVEQSEAFAAQSGSSVQFFHDPFEAVRAADVVYTDVWVSMGYETEREIRARTLRPFQLNPALLGHAKSDAIVLHCLPAHRGEEITDEVMDGPQSAIWDQAENRLHVQKALLALMLS